MALHRENEKMGLCPRIAWWWYGRRSLEKLCLRYLKSCSMLLVSVGISHAETAVCCLGVVASFSHRNLGDKNLLFTILTVAFPTKREALVRRKLVLIRCHFFSAALCVLGFFLFILLGCVVCNGFTAYSFQPSMWEFWRSSKKKLLGFC